MSSSSTSRLYDALQKFEDNKNMGEKTKKFLLQLLKSKSGKVIIAFANWKSLPIPTDNLKSKLANRFERGLSNFAVKKLR